MMHAKPERPVPFQGDLRNLPEALAPLKKQPNWVCWRYGGRSNKKGDGKWDKPLFRPDDPTMHVQEQRSIDMGDPRAGAGRVRRRPVRRHWLPISWAATSPRSTTTIAATRQRARLPPKLWSMSTAQHPIRKSRFPAPACTRHRVRQRHQCASKPKAARHRDEDRKLQQRQEGATSPLPATRCRKHGPTSPTSEARLKPLWRNSTVSNSISTRSANREEAKSQAEAKPQAEEEHREGSDTGDAFLDGDLIELIEKGVPPQDDLSNAFHHAVCWLKDHGWTVSRIERPHCRKADRSRTLYESAAPGDRPQPTQEEDQGGGQGQGLQGLQRQRRVPRLPARSHPSRPNCLGGMPARTTPCRHRAVALGNMFLPGVCQLTARGRGGWQDRTEVRADAVTGDRAPLTGEHVFQRCRVLILSLEDGPDELRRRLRAARLYHKIEQDELKGWLFMDALGRKDGKLMTLDQYGRPILGILAARLEHTIVERQIDIVMLDPFIKTHGLAENDNNNIDAVAQILTDIAIKYNIAVDVPHHMAKGAADPGNANKGRGASALKDALRLVRTATVMTMEEAQAFGLDEIERRTLIRVATPNSTSRRLAEARWFRLVGVNLGNASATLSGRRQRADGRAVLAPQLFADISVLAIHAILTDIDAGLPDGNRSATQQVRVSEPPGVWSRHCPGKGEGPARRIGKTWVKTGLLVVREDYDNPKTRKHSRGLWVDSSRRPS